ncbi:unnamed protein product [Colias eurytheme]|nr:unnamed protein product [Colias eurytheme]
MNYILLILFGLTAFAYAEHYTDRYDDMDVDEILQNRRLVTSYIKCVMDKGRCTPEGIEIKVHVKDAMQTGCEKCTDKQKKGARKVVKFIRENEKDAWKELLQKYDPKDEYKEIYEAFLARED